MVTPHSALSFSPIPCQKDSCAFDSPVTPFTLGAENHLADNSASFKALASRKAKSINGTGEDALSIF